MQFVNTVPAFALPLIRYLSGEKKRLDNAMDTISSTVSAESERKHLVQLREELQKMHLAKVKNRQIWRAWHYSTLEQMRMLNI